MIKIIIGVIIAAVVVIVGFMIIDPSVDTTTTTTSLVESTNTYSIGIEGEVENEGTYTLAEGSTIGDLIDKAGGVTSEADSRAYYETAEVESGMTYYIATLYNSTDVCNDEEIEKVNVNEDDSETLMTVNGISASVASSIVSYRTTNGEFTTLEGLLDVYGIGNATYKKIRDYVILHE